MSTNMDSLEENNTEPPDNLMYEDPDHTSQIFTQLNLLHKRGQFCDAKLIVGEHETGIHRAVLGSASPFFFDLFMRSDGEEGKSQNVYKLKEVQWETFKHLLNFIYTGKLSVPSDTVRDVYKVSCQLRMQAAADACGKYLTSCLTADNCLGVRIFAQEDNFKEQVSEFISCNIKDVTNSKKFYGLKRISIEIVGTDEDLVSKTSHDLIMPEMLSWLKNKLHSTKHNMEALTENLIVLYLNTDNSLTDCVDIDDKEIEKLKEDDMIQDYKKLFRMKQTTVTKSDESPAPETNGTATYRKFNINPETPIKEMEWSIVASHKTRDRTYVTIAMLKGEMVTISLHYRPAAASHDKEQDPDSPVHQNSKLFERYEELSPLNGMTTNRCAFGLKALDGCLFACGGYDRGECLKSSEIYNFEQNTWTPAGNLKSARGRFGIGMWENKVYACGGSSGNSEVKMLECYDPTEGKWTVISDAPAKASPGVIVFQGILYVIGGSKGQPTVATVEMYDLATGEWSTTTPMSMPRYQVGVTAFKNKIYVVGGTNGWKCLNEAEVYDPQTNEWTMMPPMKIARRGAGVDVYNGKIFVVGGNDGMTALSSTEMFDPETRTWSLGPTLSIPRANVGVATLNNRLFAVGGFSGKKFLNSVEFLDLENTEYWCSHLPTKFVKEIRRQSSNGSSEKENGHMDGHTESGEGAKISAYNDLKNIEEKVKVNCGDNLYNGMEDLTVNGDR